MQLLGRNSTLWRALRERRETRKSSWHVRPTDILRMLPQPRPFCSRSLCLLKVKKFRGTDKTEDLQLQTLLPVDDVV